ncbi:extensin family protein [Pseudorhodoplanes sp.]|uniref:extensin-like domain-containing protein n=1 Tax=Pseudorhodoplanes sp. TaxID=1934341 RepID=UPI003D0F68E5
MNRFHPILAMTLLVSLAHEAQAQLSSAAGDARTKPNHFSREPARPPTDRPGKPKPEIVPSAMTQPDTLRRRAAPVRAEVFAAAPDAKPAAPSASGEAAEPSACQLRVADRIAVLEPLPPIGGPGDCGASDVVRLGAIIQADGSKVAVAPPATVRCAMAEALANWVREDLTAAVAQLGSAPRSLDNYASYDCRGRNRVAGAKISEHGFANAIDMRGVRLANGRFAEFTSRTLDRGFRESLRRTVCARFTTVLGPGSDGYHETHIHVDLAERRGGYRLCQWNVLDSAAEVPLPRPRPVEAP